MSQALPLPEQIPNPKGKSREALENCGITLEDSKEEYITYTLPTGWRMVDDSWRQDLPNFYIVDNENLVRFSVTGAWKGAYDNCLRMNVIEKPYQFKKKNVGSVERSQTDGPVLMGQIAKALDPSHREPVVLPPLANKDDYVP